MDQGQSLVYWERKFFILMVCCVWLLVGCASEQPVIESTQASESVVEQVAPTEIAVQPTVAPLPTETPLPTVKPTLPSPPTFTPQPTQEQPPTATPMPTEAAVPTDEPSATPEPTAAIEEVFVDGCRSLEQLEAIRPNYTVPAAMWPKQGAWTNEVYNGIGGDLKLIHFGFDVEGSPAYLGELLDVLDRRGVKTTMFILGSWAESYPDWIRAFNERGHEFANHTYTHGNLREMDAETIKDELERTEAVVQRLTGQTSKPWFRPPFGSRSELSIQTAYENGYTTVIWSGSSEDWRQDTTEDIMCKTLLDGAYPGGILYSHTGRVEIPAVVDRFIGEMQSQGYTFVPLSVLMSNNPAAYLTAP